MDPVVLAFLFGGLSALSLPLGAALGIWLRPSLKITAAVMAFGAGALLCALSLEIVAQSLAHFPNRAQEGFAWLATGALAGCVIFILLDRVLANMGGYLRKVSTIGSRFKHLRKQHYREILDKLSVVDLMLSLPPEEIRRVISDIEKRTFTAGEIICHEEDPCDALYLVESGRVRVVRPDGEEELLEPGQAFGERALVTGLARVARATAEEATVVWEIHKDDFREVVEVSPELRRRLREMARNNHHEAPRDGIEPVESSAWLEAASENLESEVGDPTEADMMHAVNAQRGKGSNVALAIWLGIALDGIPESLIIGSTMEGSTVSLALIGGLFLANMPESMSSAVVMSRQGGRAAHILVMWISLMIMTAVGAALGNVFIADAPPHLQALLEGMAAGAMLAMIAQTMLPEAYDHGGSLTGLMTVIGFLVAIYMGTLDDEKRIEGLEAGHAGRHPATTEVVWRSEAIAAHPFQKDDPG
ncbi:cyclic nucleotide-binding domain-containing protein [Elongatibacter sediminis]|uniref:Cyclic nucleotide-binding domain-containing protein n=1 Tax=Elongatibacter sediminis TaxID=3119006 RepID=A0AAW9R9L8_9GAMM